MLSGSLDKTTWSGSSSAVLCYCRPTVIQSLIVSWSIFILNVIKSHSSTMLIGRQSLFCLMVRNHLLITSLNVYLVRLQVKIIIIIIIFVFCCCFCSEVFIESCRTCTHSHFANRICNSKKRKTVLYGNINPSFPKYVKAVSPCYGVKDSWSGIQWLFFVIALLFVCKLA